MVRSLPLALTLGAALLPSVPAAADGGAHPSPLRLAQNIRPSTAPPASEALIDANDADRLASLMQGWGWPATVTRDPEGDPEIKSKASKSNFNVRYYGCNKGKDCVSISFEVYWNLNGSGMQLKDANQWNATRRWGQLALDDKGNPSLALAVNLQYGVSPKNLEGTLGRWRTAVEDFEKVIKW